LYFYSARECTLTNKQSQRKHQERKDGLHRLVTQEQDFLTLGHSCFLQACF